MMKQTAPLLLSAGCLLLLCGPGHAVSTGNLQEEAAKNGVDICNDAKDANGGPAIPAYNYANSGDDWMGTCRTGTKQSPVDLPEKDNSTLMSIPTNQLLKFGSVTASGNAVLRLEVDEVELLSANWKTSGLQIPVCGVADVGCLDSPANSDVRYLDANVSNLHFHANSEHARSGLYYGAEAHLVLNIMVNDTKRLVVLGTWMDVAADKANEFYKGLQPYIDQSTGAACTPVPDNTVYNVDSLLPGNKTYYAYRGSLTTPPCTEGVTWIVFATPVKMSVAQLKSLYRANAYVSQPCAANTTNALCNVLGARTNNRALQPLNDRTIHLGGMQGITAS